MIPQNYTLDDLIHSPVEWAEYYGIIEAQGGLQNLLLALQSLPESSIRDARIGRIPGILGPGWLLCRFVTKMKGFFKN